MSRPGILVLVGAAVVAGAAGLGAQSYSPPRTPWGHPDLQGIYSNDDESGAPLEPPAQFDCGTPADITPEELQAIATERNRRFVESVTTAEFAGGLRPPAHLIFDTFERKNSRGWLVVDPPDGRILRRADVAPRRRAGGVSTNVNPRGPFNSWLHVGLYDACHEGSHAMRNILSAGEPQRLTSSVRLQPDQADPVSTGPQGEP